MRQVLRVLTKLRGILGTFMKSFPVQSRLARERRYSGETGDSSWVVCIFFMSHLLAQLPRSRVSYSRAVAYPRGV